MKRFGIASKFLIPAVSFVVIGLVLLIWLNLRLTRDSMESMLKENMTILSESIARDVGGNVSTTYGLLNVWAEDQIMLDTLRGASGEPFQARYQRVLASLGSSGIQYINLFDLKGDLLATSAQQSGTAKVNVVDRDYFKGIVEAGQKTSLGKAIQSRTTGKKVVILARAVTGSDGKLIGVLTAAIDLDQLTAQVNSIKIGSSGFVGVLEKSGATLAHPDKNLLLKDDLAKTEWGRKVLAVPEKDYFSFNDGQARSIAVRKDKTTGWSFVVFAPVSDVEAVAASAARESMLVGGVVALALAVVIVLLVTRVIGRPISKCVDFASAVAAGDLGKSLDHESGDELGTLADALRHMVDRLKEGIEAVKAKEAEALGLAQRAEKALADAQEAERHASLARSQGLREAAAKLEGVVHGVENVSGELISQMKTIEDGAENQRMRTTETATAMDEMNATVLEISRNASAASLEADKMRDTALTGKDVVNRAVTAIGSVHTVSSRMREQMGELGKSIQDIGRVLEVITDIADQTNLLALNAAIEAARAGDAGRGFAVVADEVRKLAEKTMTATKEVGDAISGVQDGARRNIENVNAATGAIDEANRLAGESIAALDEVLTLSSVTSDQIRSIATAAEEQSGASGEIDHAVKDIMAVAGEAMDSVARCRTTIDEMARLSEEFRRIVRGLTA